MTLLIKHIRMKRRGRVAHLGTIAGMRKVYCSMHCAGFRGHGTTRVMNKIVFHFCARCWRDRMACEARMRQICGVK